jgi:uncharacterized protein
VWQGSRPLVDGPEAYSFFGCTLAPAFSYGDFEIGYRDELQKKYPQAAAMIAALTREEFATRPAAGATTSLPTELQPPTTIKGPEVVAPATLSPIVTAPGITLRELVGRTAPTRTELYSVALFTMEKGVAMGTSYMKTGEEFFLVTKGQGRVFLGERVETVGPGAVVVVRPGVPHSIAADAETPLEFYAVSFPAFLASDYVEVPKK